MGLGLRIEEDVGMARAAARGDPDAREQVVRRLMTRVRNLVFHMVHDRAEAEDLSQVAMAEILVSLSTYRGGGALTHWADRIVVRRTMAHFRRRQREARVLQLHQAGLTETSTHLQEQDVLLRERLAQHLHRINAERRVVLVLRLVAGLSLEEIATETGAPLNTVKDRLRVGRHELREALLRDPALQSLVPEETP